MNHNRRFKAKIAGKDYTIVGQRSPQHLNTVVDLVNNQLEQLNELAPELSTADRSILMSINAISDQLLKEQQIIELEQEIEALRKEQQVKRSPQQNNEKGHNGYTRSELFENNNNRQRKVPFNRE